MNKIFHYIRDHFSVIYRTLLFIISVVAIVYLFPRQAKFQYEFQKGKPWMHENLIAPFDFPVYKSREHIKSEKDSVLQDLRPYFDMRKQVQASEKQTFTKRFNSKWNEYLRSQWNVDTITELNSYHRKQLIQIKDDCIDYITNVLSFVYNKGIIEKMEVNNKLLGSDSIYTVYVSYSNNSKYKLTEVFTHKQAYEFVKKRVQQFKDSIPARYKEDLWPFLQTIDYNQFLSPNLKYDQVNTQKAMNNALVNVSITRGMVQKGQRIISRGDVVKGEKYRILQSLKRSYQQRVGTSNVLILTGQIIFVFVSMLMLFLFLWNFRREILQDSLKTTFMLFLVLFFIAVSSLMIRYSNISLYIVPFALLPIIIRTFYDARLALFIHIVTILVVGFNAPNSFEFVFMNFSAGIVAIFSLTNLYRRGKLFLAAALVFLTYGIVYFGISIIKEASIINIHWRDYLWFGINGLLILTSFPLIYIFEKLFGFISDATLIELSDTNQPLLRLMAEKAPGTFQHSIQVANLAEEAIYHIGGNSLLVRAGALYHDIGKIEKPSYYIENLEAGKNPHDALEFDESAKIIIEHVTKGIRLAQKNKLPAAIIDFIRTHHGTTTVQFFYKSYLTKYPEKDVDTSRFTYPGPTPFSKETAVLMMADAAEAASRSYKEPTEKIINQLVDEIIEYQVKQEQFHDANITFKDISMLKGIFKMKLRKIHHGRIKYPGQS